jgi:hypothetical protein
VDPQVTEYTRYSGETTLMFMKTWPVMHHRLSINTKDCLLGEDVYFLESNTFCYIPQTKSLLRNIGEICL